ncbi:hypothetical protein MKK70_07480 [Methylobacterium sp. E-041]|uniref:hypothetical protein n=1 Tax=unclassified Methylobacterium TaxID=2615210 RepID=UPI001FBA4A59|nr:MULTISPECIES: hypothetical protein [unclassified Methylobacterium]MCJ2041961.1 hypothetical protein [Methylobacterium sp. J-059]MCJ2105223.1 hypothetical protein [Methylobacterium sp. E-041]
MNWLDPTGLVRRAPPKNFGVIGNGHHIKLGRNPNESTAWDQSFEPVFQNADSNFPSVIAWLDSLERELKPATSAVTERLIVQESPDKMIEKLVQGIVSLAVRSPMNREAAVSVAESLRGPINEPERSTLIGMNMRDSFDRAVKSIGTSGKFVIMYSVSREFIFGDGFYHNIVTPAAAPSSPKILVALTPNISVLYARPTQYSVNPKLRTLSLHPCETTCLNDSVQTYAKTALYYRSQKPEITEDFREAKHLKYNFLQNPIDAFIAQIS